MALQSAVLGGRKELLSWLNNLCNATYPSVESLRDGAAYCTIIEAAVSRIAQNCTAAHSPEAPVAQSRAEQARTYLGKVDWSATAFVCESNDATLDPMPVRVACSHNMQLLQDMLRNCVPVEHRYAAEASRLASGKLQDHVLLLRWLYAFMSKVLANYSRKALEKKSETVAGSVEGVKLNRTALLRSGQISGGPIHPPHNFSQQRVHDPPAPRELPQDHHVDPSQDWARDGRSQRTARSTSSHLAERSSASPTPSPAAMATPADSAQPQRSSKEDRVTPSPLPAATTSSSVAPAEAGRDKTVHSHYTRGTIAIPDHLRESLVSLRNDVEEVEGMVLYVQEQHNYYLTRPSGSVGNFTPSSAVQHVEANSQIRLDARDTLSLEELGELLEERDALAQQYAALDGIVTRALRLAEKQGKPICPLLRDLLDLLHPE